MSKWDALEGVKNEERIDKEGVLDLTYLTLQNTLEGLNHLCIKQIMSTNTHIIL